MKHTLLFLSAVLLPHLSVFATTSLQVQNPHITWHRYNGNIDTAVLSIKPKGAYFECGLYLTFSSRPYNTNSYSADSFEVQMMFDLPEGSFVHDSWLWVGNQIVQATMYDRNRAQMIYEGIVQRKRDPSILYKNGPTQYELRVYPMPYNQKRKVKITYMVPAKWGLSRVSCPLPLNILKASTYKPNLEILSYTDNTWNNAQITELPSLSFPNPQTGEQFSRLIIPSANIDNLSEINYSLQSPMQNGIYSAIYETGPNAGYYQFVMLPSKAMSLTHSKKTAFLFDHELGNSTTLPAAVLAKTRQMLLDNYAPTDSFNLLFSQFSVYQYSNTWLPCDSATINYIFNQLSIANPISSYSNLPSLLATGINFIKNSGGTGDILLTTNTDTYNSTSAANQLINDALNLMGTSRIPIHIIDFQDQNVGYYWNNGQYYYGAEYLYSNLSALTGGNFENVRQPYSYYYYSYTYRSYSETVDDLMGQMRGRITSFDAYADAQSGFCFGNYGNDDGGMIYINKPYIKIGRYSGTLPVSMEVTGQYNGTPVGETFVVNNYENADSSTRKMWVSKFLADLESGTSINNQTKGEIIDSSRANRVLSLYTAFLALEPSDTVSTCSDCEDETGTTPTTGIAEETADISLSAFPNPFTAQLTLKVHLDEERASLKIYNTLGQVVKIYELTSDMGTDVTLNWDGHSDSGDELAAGVYIVILETKAGRKTLRIVKS